MTESIGVEIGKMINYDLKLAHEKGIEYTTLSETLQKLHKLYPEETYYFKFVVNGEE